MIHRCFGRAIRLMLIVLLAAMFLVSMRLSKLPRQHLKLPEGLRLRIIQWSEDLVKPDNSRIFFHETSGRQRLSFRQSCAVESAAKHNPSRSVQVFLSSEQLNFSSPWISALENYSNVIVVLVNEEEYFSQSPFAEWFQKGEWKKSPFRTEHMSDYIRILTLYKGIQPR